MRFLKIPLSFPTKFLDCPSTTMALWVPRQHLVAIILQIHHLVILQMPFVHHVGGEELQPLAFEEPIYSEKIKVGTDGNPLTANMNTQKALTAAEFLGIDQKEIPNAGKFAQSENSGKKETTPLLTAQGGPDGAASKPKSPLLKGDERAESGVILEARGVVKVHSADPGNGPKANSKSPTKTENKKKFGISILLIIFF